MTPLPPPLGEAGAIRFWRLDAHRHAAGWDSGEGSFQVGGRWNSRGVRAVYAALDPATAILEVAVHKGFDVLDRQPHVLTAATVADPTDIRVLRPADIPDDGWLSPGFPGPAQQAFGDRLLSRARFTLLPSVVSRRSWNVIFRAGNAVFRDVRQEAFVLDPRLARFGGAAAR